MGLIEKSIRNRSNQKLAAEVFTQTALSFDQVEAAVRGYCDAKNAEMTEHIEQNQAKARTRLGKWTASLTDPATYHYYVSPHPETRQILIGFGQRPEPILAGKGNTLSGVWAARLSYPAGGNTVGLALLKWVAGGNDGALKNRSFYEILLQDLYGQIGSEAPQGGGASPAAPGNTGSSVPQPAPAQAAAPQALAPQVLAESAPPQTGELLRQERIGVGNWAARPGRGVPVPGVPGLPWPGRHARASIGRHRLFLVDIHSREDLHRGPDVRVVNAFGAARPVDHAGRADVCGLRSTGAQPNLRERLAD